MKGEISISVEAIAGTAVSTGDDWDYRLANAVAVIAKGSKEGKVVINLGSNAKGVRSFVLKITTASSACEDEKVTVAELYHESEVMIYSIPESGPEVLFARSHIQGSKQMSPIKFGFILAKPSDQDITVEFGKSDGTLTEGVDIQFSSYKVTIKAGQTYAEVDLEILKDKEGYATFDITEITGNVDIAMNTTCRIEILKPAE